MPCGNSRFKKKKKNQQKDQKIEDQLSSIRKIFNELKGGAKYIYIYILAKCENATCVIKEKAKMTSQMKGKAHIFHKFIKNG